VSDWADPGPFELGDRVIVRQDRVHPPGPFPAEPTGTIVSSGMPTMTTRGLRRTYGDEFDEPQLDADGDGPYVFADVLDVYLERIEEASVADVLDRARSRASTTGSQLSAAEILEHRDADRT